MKERAKLLCAAMFALLLPVAALAAEEGEHGGNNLQTLFKWIHFAVLAVLVFWVFGKLLPPVFRRRADEIGSAIAKATAAKAEAERLLKEAAVKLASLEDEVAAFRASAQKDAQAEAERLRQATKLDVEKVGEAAKAEIEAAERAARVELKALAAKLAVDGAESQVAQQITPAMQEALVKDFVKSLQGRPN